MTSVNPPPQLRIPDKFNSDPEIRSYFEQQNQIIFQLYQRTGGNTDSVEDSLDHTNLSNIGTNTHAQLDTHLADTSIHTEDNLLAHLAGVETFTGAKTFAVLTTFGANVVSDTDSTDDLGTTGVRWANAFIDLVTTDGVAFPATQVPSADVNTLDDYEEGSWTPGLTFGGASVGMTFSLQVGTYTKVGDSVHAKCFIQLTATGSSTGAARVTGLPFTSNTTANTFSAVTLRLTVISFADFPQGFISTSSTLVELGEITNAGSRSVLNDTNFANTSDLMVNVYYTV